MRAQHSTRPTLTFSIFSLPNILLYCVLQIVYMIIKPSGSYFSRIHQNLPLLPVINRHGSNCQIRFVFRHQRTKMAGNSFLQPALPHSFPIVQSIIITFRSTQLRRIRGHNKVTLSIADLVESCAPRMRDPWGMTPDRLNGAMSGLPSIA